MHVTVSFSASPLPAQISTDSFSVELNGRLPPWEHLPRPHLEEELRRRGLPYEGTRYELVLRLLNHNTWILSKKGTREIYKQKLNLHQKQSLEKIIPFELFPKFAPEIRLMIWECSLPGPLILHANGLCREGGIIFLYKDNTHNPAALSACRESRAVTLKRYSLAFGTSNVYANLSGGDILFFGENTREAIQQNFANICWTVDFMPQVQATLCFPPLWRLIWQKLRILPSPPIYGALL